MTLLPFLADLILRAAAEAAAALSALRSGMPVRRPVVVRVVRVVKARRRGSDRES